jgi:hypothetical protein
MAYTSRKVEFTLANMDGTFTCITGGTTEFILKKIPVNVLEMEDVCYHEGSALLFPDNPSGSKEGSSSGQEQKQTGGVAALSLVFRQFEEDPNKRLLIAGHDDTVGKVKDSFIISRKRAEGILNLLKGDENAWSDHAFDGHTIKDCQQIMKYFHHEKGWDCDPGAIDGIWGKKTESATEIFFESLEKSGFCKKKPEKASVIASAGKKWPIEAWAGVYTLYEDLIFKLLIGAQWTHNEAVAARQKISFVDLKSPFVACGESFTIDGLGKDNFRSQKNRRVEFFFFDQKETPPLPLKCTAQLDKVHTKDECPLHNLAYYQRTYIKPDDIYSVLYHLKFEYFDRIREERCTVPSGLQLKAFKGGNPCVFRNTSKNGLYELRLLNIPGGKREDDVHFVFETKNAWVYTKDKSTAPRIVYTFADVDPSLPKTPITREELWKKPLLERVHFYDLPEIWDCRNWRCRIDQKEGDFKELCKGITSTTAPIAFCLDDIVLVDENGRQEIKDKNEQNNPKNLDVDSRISLFYFNGGKLELYSPENTDAPYFSKVPFSRNLISAPPGKTVVIAFANDFYSVSNQRSEGLCDFSKWQLVGCRLAKKNDSSVHFGEVLDDANNPFGHQLFFASATGNFELHYFHDIELVLNAGKSVPRSFLMVYWSARFASNPSHAVTPAQIKNFETKGMLNAKKRWEDKGYIIEPASNNETRQIIPVFFFETKKPHSGGKEKCLVTVSGDSNTGWMGNLTSDMFREDYEPRDYLGIGNYNDIDGKSYPTLVVAHEYGHATGKDDEYSYKNGDIDAGGRNAQDGPYSQWYFGMPYDIDQGSMMVTNRAPRIRQYWFFVNWLNDRSEHADKLGKFFNREQHKIVHRYGTKLLNYHLPKTPKDFRNIYAPGDPAYLGRNQNTGTGTVDIALYKIGEDETAYTLKVAGKNSAKPWDSICVVFIKISVQFGYNQAAVGGNAYVYRADGTPKLWGDAMGTGTHYTSFFENLRKELLKLQKRFWSEDLGASNRYFRNTYLHFYPIILPDPFQRFDATGNLIESINLQPFTSVDLIVHLNDSASIGTRGGKSLQVGSNTSASWIVRYILGKDNGSAAPTGNTPVAITDLQFIQTWLRNKLGSATLSAKGA